MVRRIENSELKLNEELVVVICFVFFFVLNAQRYVYKVIDGKNNFHHYMVSSISNEWNAHSLLHVKYI